MINFPEGHLTHWRRVSRTKSQEIAARNDSIVEMAKGHSRKEVADAFGISEARVSQIITEDHESVSPEQSRAQQALRIEFLLENLFEILRQPKQIKVSPSGRPVYELMTDEETGKLIPDLGRPVYDYSLPIETTKAAVTAMERQAKLGALDIKKAKERDESADFEQMLSWARQLAAENKELRDRLEKDQVYLEAEVVENPGLPEAP
jgi:transcriptional regulator